MEASFIVTIKGGWKQGDRWATKKDVEKELRDAVKDQFEFLADKVTVKPVKVEPSIPVDTSII